MLRILATALYALTAAAFLVAGGSILLLGTGLLPATVRENIIAIGQGNDALLHIVQEFGSLMVFAGLITLWFIGRYDHSRPFHWAMTVFWGLFALVHWFDIHGQFHAGVGPLIPTMPFAIFLVVGVLRQVYDRRAAAD